MSVRFMPVDGVRIRAHSRCMSAVRHSVIRHRLLLRWILPIVSVLLVASWATLGSGERAVDATSVSAVASTGLVPAVEPTTTTVTVEPTTTATVEPTTTPRVTVTFAAPTTNPSPSDDEDGRLMMCPAANGWRPSSDGNGITATLYEYGPASVTVSVIAVNGNDAVTATVDPGQSSVSVTFPDISASAVRSVTVTAVGPGPLPAQCILGRNDR